MSRHLSRQLITTVAACAAVLALSIPAFSHGGGNHHGKKSPPIGEVVSFTGGVLTVKTNDGATVFGKYSRHSKTFCIVRKPTTTTTTTTTTGPVPTTSTPAPTVKVRTKGEDGKGHHGDKNKNSRGSDGKKLNKNGRCSSDNLKPGVKVAGADLTLVPAGLKWKSIVIILPASS